MLIAGVVTVGPFLYRTDCVLESVPGQERRTTAAVDQAILHLIELWRWWRPLKQQSGERWAKLEEEDPSHPEQRRQVRSVAVGAGEHQRLWVDAKDAAEVDDGQRRRTGRALSLRPERKTQLEHEFRQRFTSVTTTAPLTGAVLVGIIGHVRIRAAVVLGLTSSSRCSVM